MRKFWRPYLSVGRWYLRLGSKYGGSNEDSTIKAESWSYWQIGWKPDR